MASLGSNPRLRNAALGLVAAGGFMVFVTKFNRMLSTYKERHNIKKEIKLSPDLQTM